MKPTRTEKKDTFDIGEHAEPPVRCWHLHHVAGLVDCMGGADVPQAEERHSRADIARPGAHLDQLIDLLRSPVAVEIAVHRDVAGAGTEVKVHCASVLGR